MDTLFGLEYFIDVNKRVYFLYLISSLLMAALYLYINTQQKRVNLSLKLWLHPSAKVDYIYFFMSSMIKVALIFPIIISANEVALKVIHFLSEHFGYIRLNISYENVIFIFSLTLFIVSDFTRYWLHRLLHTVPFLWEFHKVHHSAKVLNPLTFYRVHPVENILFGLRYVFSIGLTTGIFVYLFGSKVGLIEVLGVNVVVFVFSLLGSNLRHSHIALAYPSFLEKIFISPKMHQIHHSIKHFDKNFGGYLSVWDVMFNSYLDSRKVQSLKFGLKKEQMRAYDSVWKLLTVPFVQLFKKEERI